MSLHESHDPLLRQLARAFGIGVTLNGAVVAIDTFYGWRSGSLVLLGKRAARTPRTSLDPPKRRRRARKAMARVSFRGALAMGVTLAVGAAL